MNIGGCGEISGSSLCTWMYKWTEGCAEHVQKILVPPVKVAGMLV
jgi:hypothetical protein